MFEDNERKLSLIFISPDIRKLLQTIGEMPQAKVYLVGGFVRDSLLGIPSHDYDIATNIDIETTALFLRNHGYTVINTNDFGTIAVMLNGQKVDIAQLSGDVYDMKSRKPSIYMVNTIEEDLRRRDFTINSMAIEYPNMQLIDPFDGIKALKMKLLDTVRNPDEVFMEDPLRMMRAARFASKYNLTIVSSVENAIKANRNELNRIAAERIHEEILKGFQRNKRQQATYALNLIVLRLLDVIFPEFSGFLLIHHDRRGHHYNEDLAQHMLDSVIRCPDTDPLLNIAVFLHDIGKMQTMTVNDDKIQFISHDSVGAQILQNRLPKLKFTSQETAFIVRIVENHLFFTQVKTASVPRKMLAKFFIEQKEDIVFLNKLALAAQADQKENYEEYMRVLYEFTGIPKILTGIDVLEFPPDIRARLLQKARYYQLIGQGQTREQLLHLIRTDFAAGAV